MTAAHWTLLALVPVAYLLGSIPFGLLVGKTRGIDPRKAGSGNIGATNVGRLLGRKFFWIVFVLDLLKGLLPMLAAGAVLAALTKAPRDYRAQEYFLWLLVGFSTVVGHMFSLFLKFKGGKGVATSAGVILGLFPYYTLPALVAISTFGLILKLTRYVSLASIIGSSFFSVAYLIMGLALGWPVFGEQWPLLIFAVLMGGMIVYKHRGNLARLRAGTESRIGSHGSGMTRPFIAASIVLVALVVVMACSMARETHELIPWQKDYPAAQAEAHRTGKPILLDFSADWCEPCQEMRRTTWSDANVAQSLRDYVPMQANVDANPELAAKFQVSAIPHIVIINSHGEVIKVAEGAMDPNTFLHWLGRPPAN